MDWKTINVEAVSLIPGTPTEPLEESALVVKLWRAMKEAKKSSRSTSRQSHSMASIYVVKPDRAGYVINPLVPAVEVLPDTVLACVLAAAELTGVSRVYVNADLERLPASPCLDNEIPAWTPRNPEKDHVSFSLARP